MVTNQNIEFRWGGTPLQDAVSSGHREVATNIRLAGGVMSEAFGSSRMFDAASRGDVKNLSLLIKHAGLKVLNLVHDDTASLLLAWTNHSVCF